MTALTTATGVGAIRFTFSDPTLETGVQNGELIREIDVFGTPTLAAPEPSTFFLMACSLLGAAGWMRWRRATAAA